MKILYIANIRIPTEKAHGVQIMEMCSAFSNAGNDLTLVVPNRSNNIKETPFEFYDIKENFKIVRLPTLNLIKFGKIGFLIQSIMFAKFSTIYALFKKSDIIYSRDELPLWFLSFFKKNLVLEIHVAKKNFVSKRVFEKVRGVIAITKGLRDLYINKYKINENKIFVAPDGVDLNKIKREISKYEARNLLGLPVDKKIILYAGSFFVYEWKGVNILLKASKKFGDDFLFVLVGGKDYEIQEIKKGDTLYNVMLIGHRPYKEIQYYMKSADVLVLPNKKGDQTSEKYTSPMKLFEYMASGNPIVASDLPSIREILNETNSVLVEPNSSDKLAESIKKVFNNENIADKIGKQSLVDIQNYSWEKRVVSILNFYNKIQIKL